MRRLVVVGARPALRVGLALLVFLPACSRREPPPPPPPPPPLEVDRQILDQAMHECFTVDCDKAHERLSQLSPDSSLRQTDDFHAIEFRYEMNQLLRADREIDVEKQRAMFDQLRNDPNYDVTVRSAASERLARLGLGRRFELKLAGVQDAGEPDAGDGDSARIAVLMKSKKPSDYQVVRTLLEPRLFSGKATADDIRTMTTICKAQKDAACLKNLKTFKLH
jgi:hypothetical protein